MTPLLVVALVLQGVPASQDTITGRPCRVAVDSMGHYAGVMAHGIDGHATRTSRDRILRCGDALQHQRDDQERRHWLGKRNCPPVPCGRLAVIFLNSGSDVNPSPST